MDDRMTRRGSVSDGLPGEIDLQQVRDELRNLRAEHRRLVARVDRVDAIALRIALTVGSVCVLLGIVLPFASDVNPDGSVSSGPLVAIPFWALAEPGGGAYGAAFAIGVAGLVVVAILTIIALLGAWHGLADGAWRRISRVAVVLLLIGTGVLWIMTASLLADPASGHVFLGTLAVLTAGGILAALLLSADLTRAPRN